MNTNSVNTSIEQKEHQTRLRVKRKQKWNLKRNWPLHVLVMPLFILGLFFHYGPLTGIIMAFQDYKPWLGYSGSPWVGMDQFQKMFEFDQSRRVIWNTFVISVLKIFFQVLIPIIFALLLNEMRHMFLKRSIQTLVYLPYFLSWVILGGIFQDLLSIDGGLVNQFIGLFGIDPIFFLGNGNWFRVTIIATDVWKDFGYTSIVFFAALAGINPNLYEAAHIDGANRFKQAIYITIPSLVPIIAVVATLALGNILTAGLDQIFNMYNPLVYSKGDIIDTYVYRAGLLGGQFSFATAVGLFKAVVGLVLVLVGYKLAYRYTNYRIF